MNKIEVNIQRIARTQNPNGDNFLCWVLFIYVELEFDLDKNRNNQPKFFSLIFVSKKKNNFAPPMISYIVYQR